MTQYKTTAKVIIEGKEGTINSKVSANSRFDAIEQVRNGLKNVQILSIDAVQVKAITNGFHN